MSARHRAPPVRRRRHARLARSTLFAGVLGGAAVTLAACGSSGPSLGEQACSHVKRSITLYDAALKATGAHATQLAGEATSQLRAALAPATLAASNGGAWQPLAATLSESSRVPERDLIHALTAQCAAGANS